MVASNAGVFVEGTGGWRDGGGREPPTMFAEGGGLEYLFNSGPAALRWHLFKKRSGILRQRWRRM